MGFSRQEYRRGLPCPPLGIFPIQGLNPCLLYFRWFFFFFFFTTKPPGKPWRLFITPKIPFSLLCSWIINSESTDSFNHYPCYLHASIKLPRVWTSNLKSQQYFFLTLVQTSWLKNDNIMSTWFMLTQMVPSGVKGRPVPKTVSTQEDRLGSSPQHYLFQLQNLKVKIYLLQKKKKKETARN